MISMCDVFMMMKDRRCAQPPCFSFCLGLFSSYVRIATDVDRLWASVIVAILMNSRCETSSGGFKHNRRACRCHFCTVHRKVYLYRAVHSEPGPECHEATSGRWLPALIRSSGRLIIGGRSAFQAQGSSRSHDSKAKTSQPPCPCRGARTRPSENTAPSIADSIGLLVRRQEQGRRKRGSPDKGP
jgi:hypothetical protein